MASRKKMRKDDLIDLVAELETKLEKATGNYDSLLETSNKVAEDNNELAQQVSDMNGQLLFQMEVNQKLRKRLKDKDELLAFGHKALRELGEDVDALKVTVKEAGIHSQGVQSGLERAVKASTETLIGVVVDNLKDEDMLTHIVRLATGKDKD